ncbi:cobalamin trafficking protein CblD-like isoform 2-T2 [Syngnathus typhle]
MATVCLFNQVLYSKTRLATYLPGINGLVQHIASTMGYSTIGSYGSGDPHAAVATSINGPLRFQHDETMSPSNVKDHLYCMPHSVGFECNLKVSEQKRILTDPLHTPSRPERCISGLLIKDFFHDPPTNHTTRKENQDLDNSSVECIIQSCPEKLKQDLEYLFPEASSSHVTVITVTQKTKNDMTAWCLAVEEERDHMLDKFFGPYTNKTLFETDDTYRLLGFQIEDLGCCRVIQHPLWGSHVFVGIIFTNAPPSNLNIKNSHVF